MCRHVAKTLEINAMWQLMLCGQTFTSARQCTTRKDSLIAQITQLKQTGLIMMMHQLCFKALQVDFDIVLKITRSQWARERLEKDI